MMKRLLIVAMIFGAPAGLMAADLLTPGDPIIAFDFDINPSQSSYPGAESPDLALDFDENTKYLNFGEVNSGLIFTPDFFGPAAIQSMQFTTANDAVERDPSMWEIYGTNDPIVSVDNGNGLAENWTLISSGTADLPDDRFTDGPVYSFANPTVYSSYKVRITGVKDEGAANSMQVASINTWESLDGTGGVVNDIFDFAIAFDDDPPSSQSGYPAAEAPAFGIDGSVDTKYLNFGVENSGFIVTPSVGSTIVDSFQISTANDELGRDPQGWELYGTNDAITSQDNGTGSEENWVLIDSGETFLPDDRFVAGDVETVNNSTEYSSYRFVVTSTKEIEQCCMQFSEIQFFGEIIGGMDPTGDFNNDGAYDCADIDALTAAISSGSGDLAFDLTADGNVDADDLAAWLVEGGANNVAATGGAAFLPGDGNLDGVVDVSDFGIWNSAKFTANDAWCSGDFNADGVVDVSDFGIWNGNKFTSSSDAAAVPEPAAYGLAMMAILGFLGFRRRR